MGGKQHSLNLTYDVNSETKDIRKFVSNELVKVQVSDQEKKAHSQMLNSMKKNIW